MVFTFSLILIFMLKKWHVKDIKEKEKVALETSANWLSERQKKILSPHLYIQREKPIHIEREKAMCNSLYMLL